GGGSGVGEGDGGGGGEISRRTGRQRVAKSFGDEFDETPLFRKAGGAKAAAAAAAAAANAVNAARTAPTAAFFDEGGGEGGGGYYATPSRGDRDHRRQSSLGVVGGNEIGKHQDGTGRLDAYSAGDTGTFGHPHGAPLGVTGAAYHTSDGAIGRDGFLWSPEGVAPVGNQ
ncbi:unnamed protein product, partial [Laminaria digitata]